MENLIEKRSRATRSWLLARAAELRERERRVRADLPGESDGLLKSIERRALDERDYINQALGRLQEGTFAVCEKCSGEIDMERLEAAAFATRCACCARS